MCTSFSKFRSKYNNNIILLYDQRVHYVTNPVIVRPSFKPQVIGAADNLALVHKILVSVTMHTFPSPYSYIWHARLMHAHTHTHTQTHYWFDDFWGVLLHVWSGTPLRQETTG